MVKATDMTRGELESLLRFYAESGLDFPLSDDAPDRFEISTQAAEQPAPRQQTAPPPTAPARLPAMPDSDVIALAAKVAAGAETLDDLKKAVEAFDGCNLKLTARHTIFEGGNRDAPMMMISDAPGRDDDASGDAITGPEGQLFDRMLAAIGRSRDDCYLGFAVPWRVPGNSAPSPLQSAICKPFVERQIELARPAFLVLLGNGAARIMLGASADILNLRGVWKAVRTAGGFEVPAIATLQPRYLLEQTAQKRYAWADLLKIRDRLETATPDS
ncbi:uracil-DNA glycosylase [Oricola indica]|jgi:uracil-DNA glycosylase family 4|uniref:uracil-DNA glycosylase n=1 Tax=Oricola indica TaxID=2872591 RepID=UPI001CBC2F83|nr:uracil-DNA glycosylase [Oricola indica]